MKNKSNKKTEAEKFPSGSLMLQIILKEYDNELNRNANLQSRTGIFFVLVGGLLAFLPSYFHITDLTKIKINNVYQAIPYSLSIICISCSFIALITSVIFFVKVLATDQYKRLQFDEFTEQNAGYKVDIMSIALMNEYKSIIDYNHKKIDKKVKWYKLGTYSLVVAIVSITISFVISIFYF